MIQKIIELTVKNHFNKPKKQNAKDLKRVIAWLFKDCKFVQYISPILLDSDNIQQETGQQDKKNIVKKLFAFFENCLEDEAFDEKVKTKKKILEYIYKQPGLTDNIILNLN